jgi:PspA-Associated protein
VIVRLMGEGQYRIDDALHRDLDGLDERAVAALDAGDEAELDARLDDMWRLVRERGERLPDDDLSPSDLIVPPSDLTLEETRQLFSEQGLIPDLPSPAA